MIYLDNAATSWPKPPSVAEVVARTLTACNGNPGRTDHQASFNAAETILACRENLAALFHVDDPLSICFAPNATAALNLALKGLLKAGDHVICTSMEHNAVWRPLVNHQENGGELSIVQVTPDGCLSVAEVAAQIRRNTRLIVSLHASNVNGAIMPVVEMGRLAHEHGVPFLVDASQSAGSIPINVKEMNCDLLAFPGHKGLLGPQGTGGLYIGKEIHLAPVIHGGTGSDSANPHQPDELPDRYEAGTANLPGIAGLGEAVRYLLEYTVEAVGEREHHLVQRLLAGLSEIKGVKVYGQPVGVARGAVVSFNIEGKDAAMVSQRLSDEWDIASRSGLHCAWLAHSTQGTSETGTVRLSPGLFTTIEEIDTAIRAVLKIAKN